MTRFAPLWQQANSYPAGLDRLLLSALWPAGGASGGVVSAVAGTMTVSVAPGSLAVPLQAGQGSALCVWDAPEVVTIAAATHPAGQTRIDLVVAQVQDAAIDGGQNSAFVFQAIAGVPAASNPAVPATPTNAFVLAQLTVPGAAANLNTATLIDRRGIRLTVPNGPHCAYARAQAFSLPTTFGVFTYDAPWYDTHGMYSGVGTLTIPLAGVYRFWAGMSLASPGANWFQIQWISVSGSLGNGLAVATDGKHASSNNTLTISVEMTRLVQQGDAFQVRMAGQVAATGVPNGQWTRMSVDYLGPTP